MVVQKELHIIKFVKRIDMRQKKPLVSIVIVNYNGKQYLKTCLKYVLKSKYPRFEIIVVDNGSSDGSVEYIKKIPKIKFVLNKKNMGPSFARNAGVKIAQGKYIAFLDNDTKPDIYWLKEPIEMMENDPSIGACQCKLLLIDEPNRFDYAGDYLSQYGFLVPRVRGRELDKGQVDSYDNILSAKSAGMIIRHDVLKDIEYFDEDYFIYVEETDLCWRAWLRNFRIIFTPNSKVYHAYSTSAKILTERQHYFLKFHGTKNYITTLIKNLSSENLVKILFPHITIWLAVSGWFFISHKPQDAKFILQGIFWNLTNIRKTMRKRKKIQERRLISDKKLMVKVMKRQALISFYRRWLGAEKIGHTNGWRRFKSV